MSDVNKFLEKQEKVGKRDQGLSIPLLMQNKVPEGFEAEEGALKVDIRPESSKLEDYDDVPVGQYFFTSREIQVIRYYSDHSNYKFIYLVKNQLLNVYLI